MPQSDDKVCLLVDEMMHIHVEETTQPETIHNKNSNKQSKKWITG